ncbi:hypothetical protein SAMN05421835_12970 [Amycolatopsis sacchari]|uniref:Uncharacterized protein n=1 Tax=Amycolatopsis sacchari TaxID=115433 RepID=A0A1I4BR84_9PSEU|nr:hypothetical protein [Amycolatopsis sacchari]SFK70351.1 hypothetical protein SAMN05421835_12970 [Amycolatopsis sacchari]
MWDSVRENWVALNEPLEGVLPFMYLDVRGLVTTGMGNLIDKSKPIPATPTDAQRDASHALAAEINWLTENGDTATFEQVADEWDAVKKRTDLADRGGGAFAPFTSLHIESDEIDRIVGDKLSSNERFLTNRSEFADFDSWPADAQFGLLSMAWALGAGFRFPHFQDAVAQRDWETAAEECVFGPHRGTIELRNAMDQQCFHNATTVDKQGLDPSVLIISSRG